MNSTILRALGALGGGTVLFYTLGFTVVRTYMHKIGLEGMFWLTKEFYVDAGANFLLEMVSAQEVSSTSAQLKKRTIF